jgi:hypothetical protein
MTEQKPLNKFSTPIIKEASNSKEGRQANVKKEASMTVKMKKCPRIGGGGNSKHLEESPLGQKISGT